MEAWEFAPPDYISAKCGGNNWVVARRTPRIVAKYGKDVIALSHKRYLAIGKQWRAEQNIPSPCGACRNDEGSAFSHPKD